MRRRGPPPSKTRITGYRYERDFDEAAMEKLLEQARKQGIVTAFDTGRGHIVWFDGPPGPELRKVRSDVLALLALGTEG